MLDWQELSDIVLPDLKATTAGGKWMRGRKLKLRTHLGAYLLQCLYNKTDRQVEYDIKDNAACQIFCGSQIVYKWRCPDHTKIEEFRSRLTPDTQQKLARGQLKRSRMKSDKTIEASGYTSVLGFNLRQLIRHNTEKIAQEAA